VLFVLIPLPMLIALIVWFISAKVLKISSLSSLIALVAMMVSSYIFTPDITPAPLWIITGIILYKHIPNIMRIFNKSESQVV
jgi:glycerol-3-phosphate acyltransferase PlsY